MDALHHDQFWTEAAGAAIAGGAAGVAAFVSGALPVAASATVTVLASVAGWAAARLLTHRTRRIASAAVALLTTAAAVALVVGASTRERPPPAAHREAGQIEFGDIVRATVIGRRGAHRTGPFTDPVDAPIGSNVAVAIRITNPGLDPVVDVVVTAALPSFAGTALAVGMGAKATNANPPSNSDTVTIRVRGETAACLRYVPGSTDLRVGSATGGVLRRLPDGVTQSGVNIGTVGVPLEAERFVLFQVTVDAADPAGRC